MIISNSKIFHSSTFTWIRKFPIPQLSSSENLTQFHSKLQSINTSTVPSEVIVLFFTFTCCRFLSCRRTFCSLSSTCLSRCGSHCLSCGSHRLCSGFSLSANGLYLSFCYLLPWSSFPCRFLGTCGLSCSGRSLQ